MLFFYLLLLALVAQTAVEASTNFQKLTSLQKLSQKLNDRRLFGHENSHDDNHTSTHDHTPGHPCGKVTGIVVLKTLRTYDDAKQACENRGWDILGCPEAPEHVEGVQYLLNAYGVAEAWFGIEPAAAGDVWMCPHQQVYPDWLLAYPEETANPESTDMRVTLRSSGGHRSTKFQGAMNIGHKNEQFPVLCYAAPDGSTKRPSIATTTCDLGENEGAVPSVPTTPPSNPRNEMKFCTRDNTPVYATCTGKCPSDTSKLGPCQGSCTYHYENGCREYSWEKDHTSHRATCEAGLYITSHYTTNGCTGEELRRVEQPTPYGMECSMWDEAEQRSSCDTGREATPGYSKGDAEYGLVTDSRHYCGHGTVYDDDERRCVLSFRNFIDRCKNERHLPMCGHHQNAASCGSPAGHTENENCHLVLDRKKLQCPGTTKPRGEHDWHRPFGDDWDSHSADEITRECCPETCHSVMTNKGLTCDVGELRRP